MSRRKPVSYACLQAQRDRDSAQLWDITGPELTAIQDALGEMRNIKPVAKAAEEDE